ncbi:MAG: dTDP-4-dehydrorhamnose reductase [Acidimicrobiaceae bacterium]
MRVLITGAGGQVGRELVELCEAAGDEVIACDHVALDVGDRDAVLQAVLSTQPDAVVHAGAWTAVDACESDPDRAMRVNALGSRNVAEASRKAGAHLVYVSTDYVFDGTKPTPYDEWDRPSPASVYGRSKWAGEHEVAVVSGGEATVVRISWVCGEHGANMVKTALRLAADGVNPKFVDDQIGNPTIVSDLVPVLRRFAVERRPGLFHVTNQGALSWFEFVREVYAAAGHDPDRVTPITTAELDPPRPAPRPANSVLDNAALRLAGIELLPHHAGSLERLVAKLMAE